MDFINIGSGTSKEIARKTTGCKSDCVIILNNTSWWLCDGPIDKAVKIYNSDIGKVYGAWSVTEFINGEL